MKKIINMPSKLNCTYESYNILSRLQHNILTSDDEHIILNFLNCSYLDAIFMAYIGGLAVLCGMQNKQLTYRIKTNSKLHGYFYNSGLYDYIVDSSVSHTNKNAIPFSEIHMDEDSIVEYINRILELAPIVLTESGESYLFRNFYEIFANCFDHSNAAKVFACGHWMPQRKRLVFSIYDIGIGIPALIKKKINSDFSSEEALRWALEAGNSTKQLVGGIPRGVGLSDLLDFIYENEGYLYIMSNDIYYSYYKGKETFKKLDCPITGTIISITIISDYESTYTVKEV